MQMKQQQELQRYLQQVQQNIETVSASELLQAIMSQRAYLGQQSVAYSLSTGTAWSSIDQLAPPSTGVIYSTAGIHQPTLPATFVPPALSDNISATMLSQILSPMAVADNLHSESCSGSGSSLPSTALLSQRDIDGLTAGDSCPVSAVADVSSVNTDISAIPDSLDMLTDIADRSCSPSVALRRSSSLKEQVRPTASSDTEVANSDQSVHVALHRKQSAEAAALLAGTGLCTVPLASSPVDNALSQLPEVSSLGFVPIQNQSISSRSGSVDSVASSHAGSSVQQSVDNSDLIHPVSVRETVAESESSKSVSCQPTVCTASVTAASSQLLDTIQSLIGQYTAGNSDAAARLSHLSPPATVEPAQQLQQSQAIIQQQQQQQLAAIASAIQNLQHLRSLQEAIGSLAVALKTSQLQMLSALQAGEVSTSAAASAPRPPSSNSVTSVVASSTTTMPAAVHPPTAPMSSCQPLHVSATAVMPPAVPVSSTFPGLVPEPRGLPPSQLTAAQLSALGLPQYPSTGNALLMPSNAVQQQYQQLLLAMMQSAPYQQQQQQLLMQQLLSQNAAMMQHGAMRGGAHVQHQHQQQQQQPWPVMMPAHCAASTVRRATPHSILAPMLSTQHLPQRLNVPPVISPASVAVGNILPSTAGTAVPMRSSPQTPVPVRPPMTSSSSSTSIATQQASLPDQR